MIRKNIFIKIYCVMVSVISCSIVLYLLGFILVKGGMSISPSFIVDSPSGMPLGSEGGIFPAIMGSIMFTLVAVVTASAFALSLSIYMVFYLRDDRIRGVLRTVIGVIAGIPSIVLGLFGYTLFVVKFGFGISLLSGGLVLGIMIFPYLAVRMEKTFMEISDSMICASYSLGVNRFYTVFHLVLPSCFKDILSTVSIGGSLAMGAAAPILLTGAVMYGGTPKGMLSPAMSLPTHLYYLISEGISTENAYATAFVMVIILLVMNGIPGIYSYMRGDR